MAHSCEYRYNPSEQYRLQHGNICGAQTFPAFEEVESVVKDKVTGETSIEVSQQLREQPDPYCPKHGGTSDPRKMVRVAATPERDELQYPEAEVINTTDHTSHKDVKL